MIKDAWIPDEIKIARPKEIGLGPYVRLLARNSLRPEMAGDLLDRLTRSIVISSELNGGIFYGKDGVPWNQLPIYKAEWFGFLGNKVITNAGVGFLVDAWQNLVELENMKFHALGTGTTAEAQTDTALVTELTTEYTGDVRATGSLTEGASGNIFRTVGTNTLDGTPGAALREHGIFSASTSGVLWDRTLYSAITLASGDAFQTTYDMTASANG